MHRGADGDDDDDDDDDDAALLAALPPPGRQFRDAMPLHDVRPAGAGKAAPAASGLELAPALDESDDEDGMNEDIRLFSEDDETAERRTADNDRLLAVTLVRDAWNGRSYDYREDEAALRVYNRFHSSWLKKLFLGASIGLLALVLFERPTFAAWLLPVEATMAAEAVLLGVMAMRLVAMHAFLKPHRFWLDARTLMSLGVLTLTVLDMVVYISMMVQQVDPRYRWSRPLRPVLVVLAHRQVRRAVNNILRSTKDMLIVVSLLAVLIGITTLFFFVLFRSNDNQLPYFEGPVDTYYDLYCLLTTDIFPDIMLPAYEISAWYSFAFIFYLMGGYYFFMSVMLAIVYYNYRAYLKEDIRVTVSRRMAYLDRAFVLLTRGGERLSRGTFNLLFAHLVPNATRELVDINWRLLCVGDSGESIDKQRFRWIVDVLSLKMTVEMTSRNLFDRTMPQVYRSKASRLLCKFVRHRMFKFMSAGVILLNALYIAMSVDVETIFLAVYWIEILLKLYAFGWQTFIRSGWNRFDLVVMTAGVVVAIISGVTDLDDRWRDLILCLRVLRLIKVASAVPTYLRIVRTIQKILPSMYVYTAVLLLLFYVFGVVGMEVWAGQMTRDNLRLVNSAYAAQNYWGVNFDSFGNACVTLFIIMVVQSWEVLVGGFEAASASAWVRVYFVVFHLLTNVLFINIIVAFILEQFLVQYKLYDNEPKDRVLERMHDLHLQIITKENEEEIWETHENLGQEEHAAERLYRVSKKGSAVAMLERMFQNELADDEANVGGRGDVDAAGRGDGNASASSVQRQPE